MGNIVKLDNEKANVKTIAVKLNEIIDRLNKIKVEEKWWVDKIRRIREQNLEKIQKMDAGINDKQFVSDTVTMLLDGAKYRIMHQAEGRVEIANEIMKCQDLLSRAPHNNLSEE